MKQAKFFLKYKLGLLKETKNEKKGSLNSGAKIQSASTRIEIGLQKNLLDFNDGNNSLFMADPEKKVIAETLLREYSDNFLSVYESFFLKAERVTLTDMARESVHVNNEDTANTNETTKASISTPAKAQDIRESETEGSGDQNDVQADTQTTNNHQTINSNCNKNTPNTPITISAEEKTDRAFAIATNVARTYYLLYGYDTQFNQRIQNIEQRVQKTVDKFRQMNHKGEFYNEIYGDAWREVTRNKLWSTKEAMEYLARRWIKFPVQNKKKCQYQWPWLMKSCAATSIQRLWRSRHPKKRNSYCYSSPTKNGDMKKNSKREIPDNDKTTATTIIYSICVDSTLSKNRTKFSPSLFVNRNSNSNRVLSRPAPRNEDKVKFRKVSEDFDSIPDDAEDQPLPSRKRLKLHC